MKCVALLCWSVSHTDSTEHTDFLIYSAVNLTLTYRLTKGTKGPNIRGICVGLNTLNFREIGGIRVGDFTLFGGAHGC